MFILSTVALLFSLVVNAAVTPTSPESATTVRIGQPLTALWSADTTGTWTDMTVQLMTGDNLNMIPLTVLSTGIDGTKDTSHSWTTPEVSPTSKIYFLQFTRTGDPSTATWTTRFTIAGADGSTSTPTNSTTYTSAQGPVQWGVGTLIGTSSSGNSTTSPSMPVSNSTSPSSSGAAGIASGGVPTISVPPSSTSAVPSSTSTSSSSSSSSRSVAPSASSASSAGAAAASSSRAAAGRLEVGGLAGMVLGLIGAALL